MLSSDAAPSTTCATHPTAGRAASVRRTVAGTILSFPAVLIGLLILLTVMTVQARFGDPDMWWHLKAGETIWKTQSIPHVDSYSFTAAGKLWVAQEWLSELTMYGSYRLGGYSGLTIWACVIGSLILIAGYLLCRQYAGNPSLAFGGAMGIWCFGTIGLTARPHMIGYLLLVCELLILRLGRTRTPRWFLALPLLFALWINCHSSFVFGIAAAVIALVAWAVPLRAGLLESPQAGREVVFWLSLSIALSGIALLVNPVGPRLIWYPFEVMLHQPLNIGSVAEWQPAPFSDIRAWLLLAAAASVLLLPLLVRIRIQADELALVAVAFVLAAQHERMLFLFGIVTMPVLCRLASSVWSPEPHRREHPVLNGILLSAVAFATASGFPKARDIAIQAEQRAPVKATAFIRNSAIPGPILNEYVFGGYLIWALPERRVFIDGRADVYEPAGVFAEYGRWATVQEDPHLLLRKYGIRLCLLSKSHPMTQVMRLLPDWTTVYSDEVAVVFARQN